MMTLAVNVQWDNDAGVWIATSDDVPGLCIQADTFDELIDVANQFAPELLELNHVNVDKLFSLRFVSRAKPSRNCNQPWIPDHDHDHL